MREKEYLIIGQGLAGSFLAWNLFQQKQKMTIVDDHHLNCSSLAAAGMVNPVTGKRLVLSQRCEELLPFAKRVYQEFEKFFGEVFFESKKIIRLFRDEQELKEWSLKSPKAHLRKYYGEKQSPGIYSPILNDKLGSFFIEQGGYCRKLRLLECLRDFFKENGFLLEERLCFSDLSVENDCVVWKGKKFDKVIFCEGYQSQDNPWFSWLPFNHAKGEILTLSTQEEGLPDAILSFGKWCIPVGEKKYVVGSTYGWDRFDCEITESAREEILDALREFVNVDVQVTDQKAGVRPIVKDLKPAMGLHPEHPSLAIFNGLASKGLIWGPFYSLQMAEFLICGRPLEADVDIRRFYEKHFS